jgi:hypothetical protein
MRGNKNVSYDAQLFPVIAKGQRAPNAQLIHQIVDRHYEELNSLTTKSVPAGTKNSRLEGVLVAKHLKHTAHKHNHHDGAVCPSSGMVLLDEHTPPWELLRKGLAKVAVEGF